MMRPCDEPWRFSPARLQALEVFGMIGTNAARAAALVVLVALGACQTPRVGGVPPGAIPGPGATYNVPEIADAAPAPSAPVTSEPLAPPPGTAGPVVAEAPAIPAPEVIQPR